MDAFRRAAARSKRRLWALALVAAACSGCAGSTLPRWANFAGDRALETALADDSFPSAAEAGLAANDEPPLNRK